MIFNDTKLNCTSTYFSNVEGLRTEKESCTSDNEILYQQMAYMLSLLAQEQACIESDSSYMDEKCFEALGAFSVLMKNFSRLSKWEGQPVQLDTPIGIFMQFLALKLSTMSSLCSEKKDMKAAISSGMTEMNLLNPKKTQAENGFRAVTIEELIKRSGVTYSKNEKAWKRCLGWINKELKNLAHMPHKEGIQKKYRSLLDQALVKIQTVLNEDRKEIQQRFFEQSKPVIVQS